MKIPAKPTKTLQRAPRIQGNNDPLLNLAEGFLTMHPRVEQWAERNIRSKAQVNVIKTLAKNVLDHDYKRVVPLPVLGKVAVSPPMGAMVLLLFGFTLGGRLEHALKRAVGGDRRELRDITFRDIPTFLLILFALEPMVKQMGKLLGKVRGIELVKHNEVLGYSQLEKFYTLRSANRLKTLMANPNNHAGLEKALQGAINSSGYSVAAKAQLRQLSQLMKQGMQAVANNHGHITPELDTQLTRLAEQGFQIITKADKNLNLAKAGIQATQSIAGKSVINGMMKVFGPKITPFSEIFAKYARNSRLGADAFALAVVGGLLGFGVTKFNQIYTEHEYKKLQAKMAAVPTANAQPVAEPQAQA